MHIMGVVFSESVYLAKKFVLNQWALACVNGGSS